MEKKSIWETYKKVIKSYKPKLNKNNPQMMDQDQINPKSQPNKKKKNFTCSKLKFIL